MGPKASPEPARGFFWIFASATLLLSLLLGVLLGLRPTITGLFILCGARLIMLVQLRGSTLSVRKRASAAFFGALLGALAFGATVFAIYLSAYTFTRERCEVARSASTLVERKAVLTNMDDLAWLAWGAGRLTSKGVFLFRCGGAEDDIRRLEDGGECPRLPPSDAECRCGADLWSGASTCGGRTVCESGPSGAQLRCEMSRYTPSPASP